MIKPSAEVKSINSLARRLLEDYEIDPMDWTSAELANAINLLLVYQSTRQG